MFDDVGKKIMRLAKFCAVITIIIAIIMAFISVSHHLPGSFFLYLLIAFTAEISMWPLYGLGQLIDDIHAIRNNASSDKENKNVVFDELPKL